MTQRRFFLGLSLFWRTFFLLAVLLAGGIAAWVATLHALETETRAAQTARHAAVLVDLARAALDSDNRASRAARIERLDKTDGVTVAQRDPALAVEPFEVDAYTRHVSAALRTALGPGTLVARKVGGVEAMWVGFTVGHDAYWLQADTGEMGLTSRADWLRWIGTALLVSVAGSAAVARLINKPLKQLSFAASRVREGDLDSRLDENTLTSEIREVNRGFNRMARELQRVEEDRAVMLAGISHDLRTPLARLRLETEMSVQDEDAKKNMAQDIDQLDAIIDKFMDYARPGDTQLRPISLAQLVEREAAAFRDASQIRISSRIAPELQVLADDTELGRVFLNLFENARRYGRGTYTGIAEVSVSNVKTGSWIIVSVRDRGPGVAPEKLSQLTTPFFRGDAARTAATGAGLGLAIVEKAMQRMGGTLELANAPDGGLVAHLRLQRPG